MDYALDIWVFPCYIITTMSRKYKPTTACRTRMMQAIEYANRKSLGYQQTVSIFRGLQHQANEGTHAGHFNALQGLYKLYGK
tara:strand:- start:1965 stop:2210 length:246 start_codon:yes stop_codon:yes gene_type:complete